MNNHEDKLIAIGATIRRLESELAEAYSAYAEACDKANADGRQDVEYRVRVAAQQLLAKRDYDILSTHVPGMESFDFVAREDGCIVFVKSCASKASEEDERIDRNTFERESSTWISAHVSDRDIRFRLDVVRADLKPNNMAMMAHHVDALGAA